MAQRRSSTNRGSRVSSRSSLAGHRCSAAICTPRSDTETASSDGLYLTGDLAKKDADGYFWFVGRKDDVIKSAGHLIGPFEVESALTDHPAVAEAAVIGKPDPTVGEIVKAFVRLKNGVVADEDLRLELLGHARKRLGAAVAPKEIEFVDTLPHTSSGKIMRRLLKARELGLPEGDTSTIEQHPDHHAEGVPS